MYIPVLRVVALNAICVSQVYYPNLGWMCVDATDPEKGNWLRYINWARSGKEQNLFPLEINRTIYYKSLKVLMSEESLTALLPFIMNTFNFHLFKSYFFFTFMLNRF